MTPVTAAMFDDDMHTLNSLAVVPVDPVDAGATFLVPLLLLFAYVFHALRFRWCAANGAATNTPVFPDIFLSRKYTSGTAKAHSAMNRTRVTRKAQGESGSG